MEILREFQSKSKLGKIRVWRIGVEGDQIITEFGDLGGKMQRVTDTGLAKNEGRSNYVSPEEAAVQQMERQILLKSREGYVEVTSGEERQNEIDWSKPLPQNLCFYKPDNSLSVRMKKLLEKGEAWLSRKRDGEMMVIACNEQGRIDMYSRRMLPCHDREEGTGWEWRHRFAHIIDELEEFGLCPKSILLGELVADPFEDNRWHVASVMKSLTPKAIDLQAKEGDLCFYVWDIAYLDGENFLMTKTLEDRYAAISGAFGKNRCSHIAPVEYFYPKEILKRFPDSEYRGYASFREEESPMWNAACAFALDAQWEGFVVVDPESIYGELGYNFRGKPDRPAKFCGKLKPEYETDVIFMWDPENKIGAYGKGKNQGQVGSVQMYQYDDKGILVYLCDCGTGFDDEFRANYSDPSKYPLVAQIKYTNRAYVSQGDKTNAFQFPRLWRVRDDKTPEECVEWRLGKAH